MKDYKKVKNIDIDLFDYDNGYIENCYSKLTNIGNSTYIEVSGKSLYFRFKHDRRKKLLHAIEREIEKKEVYNYRIHIDYKV